MSPYADRVTPVLLVTILGLLATFITYDVMRRRESDHGRAEFERLASERIAAMERSLKSPVELLRSVSAFFRASHYVERDQFATYVRPTLGSYDGLDRLSWIRRLTHEQRKVFEQAVRDEGHEGFRVWERAEDGTVIPAGPAREYFPVCYAEMLTPRDVLGFDVARDPVRRTALEQARDTGKPVATRRVGLIDRPAAHGGFMIYVPLYEHGVDPGSTDERRRRLAGYIGGAFDAELLLESAVKPFGDVGIGMLLLDRTDSVGGEILAVSAHGSSVGEHNAAPSWTRMRDVDFAGRRWSIMATASPAFVSSRRSLTPALIVIGGAVVTLLVAGYLGLLLGRALRVESLVVERTSELAAQATALAREIGRRTEAEAVAQRSNTLLRSISDAQKEFIARAEPRELFDGLLSSLLELTESEYGFIGEVRHDRDGTPYLKTHAITNIAWDDQTRTFFERHAPDGLEFRNLRTLFGAVITSGEPVISNDPANDARRGGLPEGHPEMRAFLGIPFFLGERMIGMVGIANRPGGYELELVKGLETLLRTCAQLVDAYRNDLRRREAEEALMSLNEELLTANSSLEERSHEIMQLAFAISHDLQTPLATMTGSVDALSRRIPEPTDEQSKWLNRIHRSSSRMVDMLNDLMVYAKAGQQDLGTEVVDVGEQVSAAVQEVGMEASARGIEIRVGCEPCFVRADAAYLLRTLMNLLTNAIKYSNEAGGVVEVRAGCHGSRVRVSVIDHGCGVDPNRLEEVFQPFKRARSDGSGTGLGLAIVRKYVEAIGGRAWLESDGRTGTTAVVDLPAATVAAPGAPARTTA